MRIGIAAAVALLAGACGAGGNEDASISVFAAASLTDAFTDLAGLFEDEHGVEVELNLGASSSLREQVLAGAPADVFASADEATLAEVTEGGVVFATNGLAIAVPAGNPAGIAGLADFAEADLLLGLCAEEVPCGRFAREALASAGVTPSIDTNAGDVRALLTQVASGDLDAGIVYRTDLLAAGDDVDGVAVAPDHDVRAAYPIAALGDDEAAADFVAFVLSDAGQAVLAEHGFGAP